MFFTTPYILRLLGGRGLTWELPAGENNLYISFDDGPDPATTPLILQMLEDNNAKATFFCVGENVERYPELFRQISEAGHSIGNHSYNHLKGWKSRTNEYIRNVEKCSQLIPSKLFRPPYGKMKKGQKKILQKKFRIIMWTLLSRDYDAGVSKERCLEKTWKHTKPGAIIVFHDHKKSIEKLKFVLPAYLKRARDGGFCLRGIDY